MEIPSRRRIKARPSEYLKRIWYDCITYHPAALRFLIEIVGADRVLFGTDYPHQVHDMKGSMANTGALIKMRATSRYDIVTFGSQFGRAGVARRRAGSGWFWDAGRGREPGPVRAGGTWANCGGSGDGLAAARGARARGLGARLGGARLAGAWLGGEGSEAEHAADRAEDAAGGRDQGQEFDGGGLGQQELKLAAAAGGLPTEGADQPAAAGGEDRMRGEPAERDCFASLPGGTGGGLLRLAARGSL